MDKFDAAREIAKALESLTDADRALAFQMALIALGSQLAVRTQGET